MTRTLTVTQMCVAWGRSLTAYTFVCLYTALTGPPALLVTFLTGRVDHVFVVGVLGARIGRLLAGVRLHVEGAERIQPDRPTVYCINHRSYTDAVIFEVMYPRCPKLRVLYKAEMERVPILGPAMRIAGFVPVQRENRERAFEAVDSAADRLAAGYSFLLAPEGTRGSGPTMRPFKKGGFVMAIKGQVPVVPVAVLGAGDVMPKGSLVMIPGTVTVRIGTPVPTAGLTLDDRDTLSGRVRQQLAQMLGEEPGADEPPR